MPGPARSIIPALALVAAVVPAAAAPLPLTIVGAEAGTDMATGMPVLSITLDPASAAAFAAFTADNVGRQVVLRIDGEAVTSPVVREPILGGVLQISGSMTKEDAERLAARLAAGAAIEVEVVAGP